VIRRLTTHVQAHKLDAHAPAVGGALQRYVGVELRVTLGICDDDDGTCWMAHADCKQTRGRAITQRTVVARGNEVHD
jgi:hypothetical protein